MSAPRDDKTFLEKNEDFVLKLRLVGIGGTPQIRRIRLPRVTVDGAVSYEALVQTAIQYTFPDAPTEPDDYKVTLTYYDVDNDCVTIASTEELVDAVEQFASLNEKVLRVTTDVKRKKSRPIPKTPPRTPPSAASRAETATPVRSRSPPSRPTSPSRRAQDQLQTVLESIVSVLAAAVVTLQGHLNPPSPVEASPSRPASAAAFGSPSCQGVAAASQNCGMKKEEDPKEESGDKPSAEKEEEAMAKDAAKNMTAEEEAPKEEKRPFIHGRHTCDGCLVTPIIGKRFHALNLPDYDLCEKCRGNYKGDYIQFEEVELDRDVPFQNRWHHKRGHMMANGRGKCGPGPHRRCKHMGRAPRRGRPMEGCRRENMALNEALRRSLEDQRIRREQEEAAKASAPEEQEDQKKPSRLESMALDGAVRDAIRRSLKDMIVLERKSSKGSVTEATVESAPSVVEEPKVTKLAPQVKVEKETSFSSDAAGNGDVAHVLGKTLDECAEAIDAMVSELERDTMSATKSASTSDTAKSEAEKSDKNEIIVDLTEVADSMPASQSGEHESSEDGSMPNIVCRDSVDSSLLAREDLSKSGDASDDMAPPLDINGDVVTDNAGATIVEAAEVVTGDESVQSEDEWQVVNEEEQLASDEMLARAAEVIGSALFQSDMSRGSELSSLPSSIPTITSDAPIPAIVLDRWAPQLSQLRDLGFTDDHQTVEILERLNAANIGVDSNDEVTVTQVVNEICNLK